LENWVRRLTWLDEFWLSKIGTVFKIDVH
jgi:hypothetical protein